MCKLDSPSVPPRSSHLGARVALLVGIMATLPLACGHGHSLQATAPGPALMEPDEQLGIGDVFEVRVVGEPDLSGPYQIASDGTIYYPYVGRLPAVGRTSGDIQRLISAKLIENQILIRPQISIFVREWNSRKVSVLGQVNKPGSVAYFPRMTIVDAIAAAGGFTGIAAKNSVTLRREVQGQVNSDSYPVADISEGRAKNVMLLPGDVLVVEERMF
jgi:protein involved in polysaccharide export with SLBB domain